MSGEPRLCQPRHQTRTADAVFNNNAMWVSDQMEGFVDLQEERDRYAPRDRTRRVEEDDSARTFGVGPRA